LKIFKLKSLDINRYTFVFIKLLMNFMIVGDNSLIISLKRVLDPR